MDADGDIWVAIYGGGRVHRYSPEGVLREELLVPAAQSTSCAFAGTGAQSALRHPTATEGWSDEQRRAQPAAGLVYRFDTDATGRPAAPFRPEPTWWAETRSSLEAIANRSGTQLAGASNTGDGAPPGLARRTAFVEQGGSVSETAQSASNLGVPRFVRSTDTPAVHTLTL